MFRHHKKPLVLLMVCSLALILISCEQMESNSNNEEIPNQELDEAVLDLNSNYEEVSTQDLVEAVLDSGIVNEVHAYNTIQMGFDSTVSKSDDLKELLIRDDSAYWLLSSYQSIDPLLPKKNGAVCGKVIIHLQQAQYKPFQQKILEEKELYTFIESGIRFISEFVQQAILDSTEQFILD